MTFSRFALPLLALLLLAPASFAKEEAPLTRSAWLGLPSLDDSGRTPFRPSTVFERYLWKTEAAPPQEGESVKGRSGREGSWSPLDQDAEGNVAARGMAVAYQAVLAAEEGVWLVEVFRASALYVNGSPVGGDGYGHGITKVPVFLEQGVNHVYSAGFRGPFRVSFERAPAPVFIADWDATLPDLVAGERVPGTVGVIVVNATNEPISGLTLEAATASGGIGTRRIAYLPPLGQRKTSMSLGFLVPADARTTFVLSRETPEEGDVFLHERTLPLEVRESAQAYRRTFVSWIDDSAQFYGLRHPQGPVPKGREMGLVLTLHGAGVDGRGQANAYHAKPDFWIVAPTNRRPFGFDWQDWGRRDAYEALRDARHLSGVDRANVHLTGHSMGGHGTWHLAVNDPDGFASAAPSAGWSSFDTYAGGRPDDILSRLWKAADAASATDDLLTNLREVPIYILHGTKDDNVPAREARELERKLQGIAGDLQSHYEEGQGHWWNVSKENGADCVDWPGFFALFRRARIREDPTDISVTFADLSVDAEHHWIRVEQPRLYGSPIHVDGQWNAKARTLTIETKNARRLGLNLPDAWAPTRILLDGAEVPATGARTFVRRPAGWELAEAETPGSEKRPERMGPFKRAFDNHFTLVYGTRGTPQENAALLASARFDAEQWRYRANGRAPCVPDTWYLKHGTVYRDRNVILYGNATTNAAWDALVPATCPIRPERGRVSAGVKTWEGDAYGILLVYPRKGSDRAMIGAVADTGAAGTRLNFRIPYFLSGVGIPDFVIYGPEVLASGDQGVRAAGFFDATWQLAQ